MVLALFEFAIIGLKRVGTSQFVEIAIVREQTAELPSRLPDWNLVDFGCQDEIVFAQAADRMRPDFD